MSASPYAAPNTPIASSKRARKNNDSLKSPSNNNKNNTPTNYNKKTTPSRTPPQLEVTNSSSSSSSSSSHFTPPSPSKIIFSPALRADLEKQKQREKAEAEAARQRAEKAAAADQDDDDDEEEFDPYLFIKGLPRYSSVSIRGKRCLPSLAPNDKSAITLTLDLDETLVHCSIDAIPNPDIVFPVSFHGQNYDVYVRRRPHLDFFLESVSKLFEVVVFTASQKVYADKLLDIIDPEHKLVKHRLFREACLCVQGNFIKDLDVLGRDLSKTVLVDNSPHAYGYNIDNGIPIISWYDDEDDKELLKLLEFLKRVRNANDVRTVVREHFKTHKLVERAGSVRFNGLVPPF